MAACHLEVAHAIRGAGFAGQRAFFGSAAGPGRGRTAIADPPHHQTKCAKSAGSSLIKVLTANRVCVDLFGTSLAALCADRQ